MKIAIMGDIHSNHYALEACLKYIYDNDFDGIAFLGDYVSDCPYPQKTMRLLKSIPESLLTWFVRGNREDYMLNHRFRLTEEWEYNSQSGSLLYTFENLTGEDLRFFEGMPIGMEVKLDGYPPFSICHGSMQDNTSLFVGDCEKTHGVADEMTTQLLVCGHCHMPYVFTRGAKTIVNAGAVGNPIDGQTAAQMVQLYSDGGEWHFEQITVPFDTEAEVAEFYESGLIDKANVWSRAYIAALREGVNYTDKCVKYVREKCAETGLPFSCEELWQSAAEAFGI